MDENGKGWHNESMRHREARLNGCSPRSKTYLKAGKRFQQPKGTIKGKTYTMNGKKSTFLLFPSKKTPQSIAEKEITPEQKKKYFEKELSKEKTPEGKKYYKEQIKEIKSSDPFKEWNKNKVSYSELNADVSEYSEADEVEDAKKEAKEKAKEKKDYSFEIQKDKVYIEDKLSTIKRNSPNYDERVSKQLQDLEDKFNVDLTEYYGEDYSKQESVSKLRNKLYKQL